MSRWRFLLSARWMRYFLLAVVFAIACAGLANWQLARRAEKVAELGRILANYDARAVPLGDVLRGDGTMAEDDKWTPVVLTGEYATEDTLLVRNRPRGGIPGFEVLVPFLSDAGGRLLVDRGWLPIGETAAAPVDVPAAPAGTVSIVVRLKPGEPNVAGSTSESGVLASIHLPEVERITGEELYDAYGLLDTESPEPTQARPLPAIRPAIDEGPHLSYAFQWAAFALIGFAGLAFAIREERRHRNADDPGEQARAAKRAARSARRRSDADEEDALLDSSR
ncbi:MAG: hypothetical protein JWP66_896 [Naasia sp.]|nr:hypothetical protein [Naasia sp.]